MTSEAAVATVIDALEALEVPYMLVGAFSANAYGLARSTKDADFVVDLQAEDLSKFVQRLGPGFSLDPQMRFETITGTNRFIVNIASSPFKIELFLLRTHDEFDRSRFARRVRQRLMGRETWMPTAEDVVVQKLRWSRRGKRNKDFDDARDVIAVQAENLDWDYIHHWCDAHGTRELLEQVRRSIPPI